MRLNEPSFSRATSSPVNRLDKETISDLVLRSGETHRNPLPREHPYLHRNLIRKKSRVKHKVEAGQDVAQTNVILFPGGNSGAITELDRH